MDRGTDLLGYEHAWAPTPLVTREKLAGDLRALGVEQGQTLLVHAKLRAIGCVEGGAATVVAALRDSVGEAGTVVMPAITPENSTTSRVFLQRTAGLSRRQVAAYRAKMPAFDRRFTPAPQAGKIAEALRTMPGSVRSDHPQSSFVAIGARAAELMADHHLKSHLGERSPLAGLYNLRDAAILMIGVGYESCSALHLAEYRYTDCPPRRFYECVISVAGQRSWIKYVDVELDDREFELIGSYVDVELDEKKSGPIGRYVEDGTKSKVGAAECRLMPLCPVVDIATGWMASNRS